MFAIFVLLSTAAVLKATTPMQSYVEAMQPGWNLGNTLDAVPNETAWGNPLVTQEFIQQLKAQGFKSIRIPVTWDTGTPGAHIGPAPTYTVDPVWMARVQQVVDWSLDAGLYVMLNMHHDSAWYRRGILADHDEILARYSAVWSQIAPRFRDHSNKLMFESMNEPEFDGVDDETKMSMLHELNTTFFNLVRSTGGGNATRPLVLPTVVTNASQHYLDSLKATMVGLNDPNLIATIHFYGFWFFSVNIAGGISVDDNVLNDINTTLNGAYNTFVADGIPVVVGELGLLSFDGTSKAIERGELLKFFEIFTGTAQSKGITWQLWDAGGVLFNRSNAQLRDPELYSYLMRSVTGRSSTAQSDLIFVEDGTPLSDVVMPLNLNGNSFVSLTNGATPLTQGVDYTFDGSALTIKAAALAGYATGALGEKTVLTANFSGGPGWKLHVRHSAVPVLAAATGSKGGGLVIPAAFNGDLVATMEAKYVAGGNAGPNDWTSYKEYTETYLPDYTNNTILIKKKFFDSTTNNPIDLTFHFWSGRIEHYRLTFQAGGGVGGDVQEWVVYDEGLAGWNNWGSWATNDPENTTVVHSGTKAISVDAGAYGGLVLQHNPWETPVDTSAYHTLVFWIHGGSVGGQNIGVQLVRGDDWSSPGVGIAAPIANTWTKVEIPLASLGVEGSANITRVMFQNWTDQNAPTYYIDDIKLTTAYASTLVFVNGAPAPVITSAISAGGVYNSPFNYATTAINNPVSFSATDLPPGLAVDANTGVISGTPTAAGSYLVTLVATNAAGADTQILKITIAPAPLTFTLVGGSFSVPFMAAYDGGTQPVTITTNPPGIPVTITYNGSTTPPTLPGTYHVVVTSNDPNYIGSAEGTLVITITALVRHAPVLNGDLDGSLQLLTGESFTVNSSGLVSDNLLVPGTPKVQLNGSPMYGGTIDATGATSPTNYTITLNSGAVVSHVVRHVDALAMPVVTAPAKPTGTRDVTLNSAGQNAGSFTTIRNLTLNSNAGSVTVPAGVYGSFTINGSSSVVLGVAGATEPAVYQLQGLTISSNASVKIVGPVKLKLANGITIDGTVGAAAHPKWLALDIATGGLTANGNAKVHAVVTAPSGSVTVNGKLYGRISADRLTINGSGAVEDPDL